MKSSVGLTQRDIHVAAAVVPSVVPPNRQLPPADTATLPGMAAFWYDRWDAQSPGSRFTEKIEFVIGVGDFSSVVEGEGQVEWEDGFAHLSKRVLADLSAEFPDLPVRVFDTSHGRGASGDALGIVLDILTAPDGLVGTTLLVKKAYDLLVANREGPTVSLGAAKHLCLADLLQHDTTLDPDKIRTLLVTEASPPGPPSELDHTGLDMFTVLFGDSENTRSWLYLIDCGGKILHRSEGEAIPEWTLWFMSGGPVPED